MKFHLASFTAVMSLCAPLVFLAAPQSAQAFPEPSIVGLALLWRYEFDDSNIGCIGIEQLNGDVHYYWYMKYTVENNSGEDKFFAPEFEIITDVGSEIITANKAIPAEVYEKILTKLADPKIKRPSSVVGKFGQGVTNAKDSVAVWPNPKKHYNQMTIFVAGLSGEQQRWTYGRYVTVTDKRVGKVVYDKELKTAADRGRVPRAVLRNLKHVDLQIDELKKLTEDRTEKDGPRGSTIIVENKEKKWVITYEDLIFKIVIVQYKKGSFDTTMRRQRRIVFELPGRPLTPVDYEITTPKKDWIMR
jgi:hypothetical protein